MNTNTNANGGGNGAGAGARARAGARAGAGAGAGAGNEAGDEAQAGAEARAEAGAWDEAQAAAEARAEAGAGDEAQAAAEARAEAGAWNGAGDEAEDRAGNGNGNGNGNEVEVQNRRSGSGGGSVVGRDVKGVMFDFSGTLFRVEPTADWLRAVLTEAGIGLPEAEIIACAALLEEAGALPGGASPRRVPDRLEPLWRERDLSTERHRAAYTALTREVPLPSAELADALYERHRIPAAWRPYPDTAATLAALRDRGVPVAVVSNIGWDLRPVFRAHGMDRFVDAYVLSFEHGVQKPDPRLFRVACEALGAAPADVLMVGDDAVADAGAAALGCPVRLVEHLPVEQRPHGLSTALGLHGLL